MLYTTHPENGKYKDLTEFIGPWKTPGYLMAIGGADRLDSQWRIGKLFCALVRRAEANSDQRGIVLVSTATRHPEVLTGEYIRIYTQIGVGREEIQAPLIRNRDEAQRAEVAQLLAGAAGIFITGGDQYTLTQMLDKTPAEDAIMGAYGRGAVVAGTSAGATAMGRPMIVAGGGSGELKMGVVQMSHGLGWLGDDIIVDTHFGARGRFPRLVSAVAEHPATLGVGVDENSCLLVDAEGICTVGGTGVVYFIDASGAQLNTAHGAHTGFPISVGSLSVNVLASGQQYDLRSRKVLLAASAVGAV